MAFRPSALQRRILEFMRSALLEGLPELDGMGRRQRGVTIRARDAVHDVWIRAALMPIDQTRVNRFDLQLRSAIEELRLRRCIEPVEGKVRTSTQRWRRPDGNSVLLAYRGDRGGSSVEMAVGRIRRGKLRGIRSRVRTGRPTYYRLRREGFAVLDRMIQRVSAARKVPGDSKKKQPGPAKQPIGSAIEVDEQTFTISAEGRTTEFDLRRTMLLRLLKRLADHPGRRILYRELCGRDAVWDEAGVEPSTIKGAVHRLRKFLKSKGLSETAARLSTGTLGPDKYVVLKSLDTF